VIIYLWPYHFANMIGDPTAGTIRPRKFQRIGAVSNAHVGCSFEHVVFDLRIYYAIFQIFQAEYLL
jgi:hypothetical protein